MAFDDIGRRRGLKFPLIILFVVLLLALLGAGAYLYMQNGQNLGLNNLFGQKQQTEQDETDSLVAKVGELYVLPTGEEPTIATVSDISKLKGQEFFARAVNGDKVLIYTKAQKAILYRPSVDKIIEVGPVNIDPNAQGDTATATESAQTTPAAKPKVVLLNGTTTTGLTRTFEQELDTDDFEVVDRDNAEKSTYTDAIIVDLTGRNKAKAQELAQLAGGTVGKLPAGETKPADVDILVILGKEYADK